MLPNVVRVLNKEVTHLAGKKPAVAIKEKRVAPKPSTPYSKLVGVNEEKLPSNANVRYLYQSGELEGGTKRATDPMWCLKVSTLKRAVTKPHEPLVYYFQDGGKRGFVCEGLLVVTRNTQLSPGSRYSQNRKKVMILKEFFLQLQTLPNILILYV